MGGRVHGSTVRAWLRNVEVFAGPLPEFAADRAPADPVRQSRYLTDTAARDHTLATSLAPAARAPSSVAPAWTLHTLAPAEGAFRQAANSRLHTPLRHERAYGGWERFPPWS
ncbi:hypothetical protein GCM10010211_55300 [Streptomyces albospinus]|uniref:Uncharacterized protein n=1 Tax=Streptomyces albospinus TaxID=285515 RepID=A0ABQ2VH86_9ACTN|nr:hypothetical protein [Streptomyces albospinus]GGU82262.1 hypothetical protein GCM10010211_55300 [Streptomyces albospinus]